MNIVEMASIMRIVALMTLAIISTLATTSPPNLAQTEESAEVGLNWSFYNIAAVSTAVLAVGAGFAALVSLFLPVFVYKLCYIFGGCRDPLQLLDQFVVPRKVNQRSIDYLEPMLTTLADAYDKYADGDLKKKSTKLRF